MAKHKSNELSFYRVPIAVPFVRFIQKHFIPIFLILVIGLSLVGYYFTNRIESIGVSTLIWGAMVFSIQLLSGWEMERVLYYRSNLCELEFDDILRLYELTNENEHPYRELICSVYDIKLKEAMRAL